MNRVKKIGCLTGLVLALTACDTFWNKDNTEDNGPFKGLSAKQLYTEANEALRKEQYASATKRLEAMESMYPFSDYAERSQLNLIYAYYKNSEYPAANATAERFTRFYPRAKSVDYAYYMKGLANFQQARGSFATVLPLDETWRDPGTQATAYTDFATLIQRFPNSRYKANALQRMIYLRNTFAQHELNTARYYFSRKMYVASAERASYLITHYPQAPSVQSALTVLYHANRHLGLNKAADEALTVYRASFPQQAMPSQPVLS